MRTFLPLVGKSLLMLLLMAGGAVGIQLLSFSSSDGNGDLEHQRLFNESYKVFGLTLPGSMDIFGEKVPLELLDVRERLDRELLVNTYWQSNSLLIHKRANRWFPVIEPILRREGVPDDMKYLAVVESGLTNAVSPLGATGFWQFMQSTAEARGLEVNDQVDERYSVEKSTEAACAYLKEAHATYGSWALAAASFNLGQAGLNRQLGRQKVDSYFELLLPEETARYVFRMLAMKAILSDPERYGFHLRPKDLYPPYLTNTVQVSGPVEDLNDFAVGHGTNYKTLKLLNPWLRDNRLDNPDGKTYTVQLPAKNFESATVDDD
jgi:hypothetical protein